MFCSSMSVVYFVLQYVRTLIGIANNVTKLSATNETCNECALMWELRRLWPIVAAGNDATRRYIDKQWTRMGDSTWFNTSYSRL